MAIVGPGHPGLGRIAKALGIEHAKSLSIHLSLNDLVMVDAFFMATEDQLSAVEDELEHKRYYLVEAEPDDA